MEILFLISGLVVGAFVGWLLSQSRTKTELAKAQLLREQVETLSGKLTEQQTENQQLKAENSSLSTKIELLHSDARHAQSKLEEEQATCQQRLDDQRKAHERMLEKERETANERLSALRQSYEQQIATLKDQNEKDHNYANQMLEKAKLDLLKEKEYQTKLRQESDRIWNEKLATLQEQMQKTTAEQLAAKQTSLQEANRKQMDELLQPVKEQFAEFKKAVDDSKTQNQVSTKQLEDAFASTMKLFQQEHQQAITSIKEQTQRIGTDAENLTKALKGDSKVQGDWGEMVLETMLENSGLRKNEEYFVQENTKDEEGRNFRPDVIIRFPEGRAVVIDSKVSLTNYAEAVATDDEKEQERLLREHAKSVRRHVDELADKTYNNLVTDSIGFVLMFIPNEASYIAAVKQMPDLQGYAYQRHVIMISAGNLNMTLHLVYNIWQNARQNKNVETIVKKANSLYDKVVGFEESFNQVGKFIDSLSASFANARKQLYEGQGNIMKKVEDLKSLGITPKKSIKGLPAD